MAITVTACKRGISGVWPLAVQVHKKSRVTPGVMLYIELHNTMALQYQWDQKGLRAYNPTCKNTQIGLSWTRQIWGIWKLRPAYSPETPNFGKIRWCFVPCDLEIWWMTLENNRASLLCCFKLCATFDSHLWIQTGVTVRKRPIWVKFADF